MEFIDLHTQQARLHPGLSEAINRVLAHGRYIMGPEVQELENTLSEFAKTEFCLTCANGTDALSLALLAMGIGAGDAVLCPSFTYSATAESIAIIGATPVFVDIDRHSYNMCPESLERTIKAIKSEGRLNARAVIVVDLFGQSANYPDIIPVTQTHNLRLISDTAQSFGTTLNGFQPAHWADIMTTSFFPAKPLGCYGDGGAIFTNDPKLHNTIDSLRVHGRGKDKYDNVHIGLNSRLDTLQAAILLEKLRIFPDELKSRNQIATHYIEHLNVPNIKTPKLMKNIRSSWAQFTIEVNRPDDLAQHLKAAGIPTARYYPRPTHQQSAYVNYPKDPQGLSATQEASEKVISLPIHAYLDSQIQTKIINEIHSWTNSAPL